MSIRIQNLTKSFGELRVLENLDLTIEEHGCTCLMGPSGCGKTTLLNIIMGFEQPDSGVIDGVEGPIAAVFQENRLCESFDSVQNVLLVRRDNNRNEAVKLLSALGLKETESLNKPVRELSGGMARRVAIARSLAAESSLVILDEPFKGLDEETKLSVMQSVKQYTEGKTLLLVTHDISEAAYFTKDNGCIVHIPGKNQ